MKTRAVGKIFSLAGRNLLRNHRRTLTTLLFVIVGVVAMGLARGYFVQTIHGLQEITIRSGFAGSLGSGHIILTDQRYVDDEERYALEFGIDDAAAIIDKARVLDGFDYALARTQFGGLASNGEKSVPFKGYAVDPPAEARLRDGLKSIAERASGLSLGEELRKLDTVPFGVLVGKGLARALHLDVGDALLILSTTVDGAVNAIDVEIVGLLSTGSDEVDRVFVVVSHDTASKLINSDRVGEISIMLKDRTTLVEATDQLSTIAGDISAGRTFSIKDWEAAGVYYPAVRDLFAFMFGFLETIIIVIVLVSSWNIVSMTTMERVREIGTLRAIGLSLRSITGIFLAEGLIVGVLAVVLGLTLQVALSFLINNAGIEMPPVPGGNQGFILKIRYLTEYHPYMVSMVLVAMVAASFSAFFTIKKLTIVQALDHT